MQKLIPNNTYTTAKKYRALAKGTKITFLGQQDADPNFGFFREWNNPDTFFWFTFRRLKRKKKHTK